MDVVPKVPEEVISVQKKSAVVIGAKERMNSSGRLSQAKVLILSFSFVECIIFVDSNSIGDHYSSSFYKHKIKGHIQASRSGPFVVWYSQSNYWGRNTHIVTAEFDVAVATNYAVDAAERFSQ